MSDIPDLLPAKTGVNGGDTSSVTGEDAGLRRRGRGTTREEDNAGQTTKVETPGEDSTATPAKKEPKERKTRVRRPRERSKAPSEASESEGELDLTKVSPAARALLAELEAEEEDKPSPIVAMCRNYLIPLLFIMALAAVIAVIKPGADEWRKVAGEAMMSDEEQLRLKQEAGILPKPDSGANMGGAGAGRAPEGSTFKEGEILPPLRLPQRKGEAPIMIDEDGQTQSQVTELAPTSLVRSILTRVQHELPGVLVSFSGVQEQGGNLEQGAMTLVPGEKRGSGNERFIVGNEFAHFHMSADNSLHAMLPESTRAYLIQHGWGLPGRIPANPEVNGPEVKKGGLTFVYGPRSEKEAQFIFEIVKRSWGWATGRFEG